MNKVYNKIESITGNVITVKAKDVKYKEWINESTRQIELLILYKKIIQCYNKILRVGENYVRVYS